MPTWRCASPRRSPTCSTTFPILVVKEVNGSGGYGHAGRAACDPGADRGISPQAEGASGEFSSRSRRWRCPPVRPSSLQVWRRAMWICAPSCSRVRTGSRSWPGGLTPRGAEGRLAGGEFQPGEAGPRIPGCSAPEPPDRTRPRFFAQVDRNAFSYRLESLLAVSQYRARRFRRPHSGCHDASRGTADEL